MPVLQDILSNMAFADLPPAWTTFNLETFSRAKRLWDYQQEALQYALKALWKYYEEIADYWEGEPAEINAFRKEALWQWYVDNGLEENLDIPLDGQRREIRHLLESYYSPEGDVIPYRHLINRMGFWMATGSGKSLVLVKLLELLWRLMEQGEIPRHDLLLLTARDDLLAQMKAHVDEFNEGRHGLYIRLVDLRTYPEIKRSGILGARGPELVVFYYRSDNLSDEQKERIVDFRNYDNGGRWYVLLDEAHKGDKEDSKRQHIYSILSRNGFLFNFSATFTDPRDIVTTVYDFNLARFVEEGYGKHIAILRQENRAFRDQEDYTGVEKQRVVLKALLMLAYVRQTFEYLSQYGRFYHRPLLLALVNSVNVQDADLKLFFREMERIGRGRIDTAAWEQAREELWAELEEGPEFLFEGGHFQADRSLLDAITPEMLLRLVYNAPSPGITEVMIRPSNRQEMAFKLKSADQPFALVKIGDISGWLKEELAGYEVVEGFEDEGFFRRLNEDDSAINILMGSRSFYEGWDSNRPNVITYINIGTGTEARKFILQSVGRGVRIEPVPGQRKRLLNLHSAGLIDPGTFHRLGGQVSPLETLFIFGTNRVALHTVIQNLSQEKRRGAGHEIARPGPSLTPIYQRVECAGRPRELQRFEITEEELALLAEYVEYVGDDCLLMAHHGLDPKGIRILRTCLREPERYFSTATGRRYGRVDLLLSRLLAHFRGILLPD